MKKILFIILVIISIFLSPALALFTGIAFAVIFASQFEKQTRTISKYLLQASVVGLGFGMNIIESLKTSGEGMLFTIISVVGVMSIGVLIGRYLKIDKKLSYLISSGTAICGGSAIAAIAPVIKSDSNQTSMSLSVIFTLNAIAMFIFPPIGHFFEMTQQQFGTWAAIAIHDTSSVVGAGEAYGPEALMVATTVKLTRALWIIPLSLLSSFLFPDPSGNRKKISIPWFIFLFIGAMIMNTYLPINQAISEYISLFSHKTLSLTLFLIGSMLSIGAIRKVGGKPVILGIILWVIISIVSLLVICL